MWVTEGEISYKEAKCLHMLKYLGVLQLTRCIFTSSCSLICLSSSFCCPRLRNSQRKDSAVFCNKANWTQVYCCSSKFRWFWLQCYIKPFLVQLWFEMNELFKTLNTYRTISVCNCITAKRNICTEIFLWHCMKLLLIQAYLYVELFQGRLA